jgi:hypothetical protein
MMRHTAVLFSLTLLLVVVSCSNRQDDDSAGQTDAMTQNGTERDISTATLVGIDPEIQRYDDVVRDARMQYEQEAGDDQRQALLHAYVEFGDYMQYESPVSPRQGKYHRALVEYRHALALDPTNEKVLGEIAQIEDIYRSMGRPIPGEESM